MPCKNLRAAFETEPAIPSRNASNTVPPTQHEKHEKKTSRARVTWKRHYHVAAVNGPEAPILIMSAAAEVPRDSAVAPDFQWTAPLIDLKSSGRSGTHTPRRRRRLSAKSSCSKADVRFKTEQLTGVRTFTDATA